MNRCVGAEAVINSYSARDELVVAVIPLVSKYLIDIGLEFCLGLGLLGTIHISADAPEGGGSIPRCHKGVGLAKVSADICL